MNNCNVKITFCAAALSCFPVPEKLAGLALQPVITPELLQGRVQLRCSYSPASPEPPAQFRVLWSRLSSPGKREQVHQEITAEPFSSVEMDGANLRLGDTVMAPCPQQRSSHTRGASNPPKPLLCFISAVPRPFCSELPPKK